MAAKLSREQVRARRGDQQALAKALRAAARHSGWRSVEGAVFKEEAGWFISGAPEVSLLEVQTRVVVSAKPMAVDGLFWDLMGLPDNHHQPLSFRLTGAWTCPSLTYHDEALPELPVPEPMAAAVMQRVMESARQIVADNSVEQFVAGCWAQQADQEALLVSAVTGLCLLDRHDEALALCCEAVERSQSGGFVYQGRSFVTAAQEWLTAGAKDLPR